MSLDLSAFVFGNTWKKYVEFVENVVTESV